MFPESHTLKPGKKNHNSQFNHVFLFRRAIQQEEANWKVKNEINQGKDLIITCSTKSSRCIGLVAEIKSLKNVIKPTSSLNPRSRST